MEMAGCGAGDGYDHLFKVVLIGDTRVGKSSLLKRFTRNEFSPKYKPTSVLSKASRYVYFDGTVINSEILDISVEELDHMVKRVTYHDAVGAVIVYDVTRRSTFEKLDMLLSEVRDYAGPDIVVMLIGNKSDLSDPVTVPIEDGRSFAERKSISFIETSAKNAVNVEKAFVELITRIHQKVIEKTTKGISQKPKITNGTDDANASVLRCTEKNEPAHYMLKIESYSILSEAGLEYESDVFEASGHKWRLKFYPNGNLEENGGDHISLYLVICNTGDLPKGWEVNVYIKFYVYDHIRHNYLIFLDADAKRTRFHEKKTEWGFDKLMSLDAFKEAGNGYLINDSCVFGAEVLAVPKYAQKDQCLSMIKPPPAINNHTWTIDNFSALTAKFLCSDDFKVGKFKWKLLLYPKGKKSGKSSHLAIYLSVFDPALLPDGWRVYAKFKLRVKNQSGNADIEEEADHWFCESAHDRGFSSFKLLSELNDSAKGFLVNDTLIVEAEISIVGTLKNFI